MLLLPAKMKICAGFFLYASMNTMPLDIAQEEHPLVEKKLALDRNLVWLELPVKSLALGVLYTAVIIFIEMFVLKVFENTTVHLFNVHNGYLAAIVMSFFLGMGTLTGTGAYFWDKYNSPTQSTSDHVRHHEQKNPFRQLYNIFPWLFITISHRFDVLKTHEEHKEGSPTPYTTNNNPLSIVSELNAFSVTIDGCTPPRYGATSAMTVPAAIEAPASNYRPRA